MTSDELNLAKARINLIEQIVDNAKVQVNFHKQKVDGLPELSDTAQREIALAWLKHQVLARNEIQLFQDVLTVEYVALLLEYMTSKIEEEIDEELADLVLSKYYDRINAFVVDTLTDA